MSSVLLFKKYASGFFDNNIKEKSWINIERKSGNYKKQQSTNIEALTHPLIEHF